MATHKETLIDALAEAITGQKPSRAIHEIQSEILTICNRIEGGCEVQDWAVVYNLAKRLEDLAERGAYHSSQSRAKEIGAFAMNGHREQESR